MEGSELIQATLRQLEEDTAFNALIWANSLKGTGNNDYQNEFYDRQADKIRQRYDDIVGR